MLRQAHVHLLPMQWWRRQHVGSGGSATAKRLQQRGGSGGSATAVAVAASALRRRPAWSRWRYGGTLMVLTLKETKNRFRQGTSGRNGWNGWNGPEWLEWSGMVGMVGMAEWPEWSEW
jgi:hypothetical protein